MDEIGSGRLDRMIVSNVTLGLRKQSKLLAGFFGKSDMNGARRLLSV